MNELRKIVPPLVALWGWALLAVAGAPRSWAVGAAVVGLLAAVLAQRLRASSAVVEAIALVVVVAAAPDDKLGFVVLGAVLAVAARAIARALPGDG